MFRKITLGKILDIEIDADMQTCSNKIHQQMSRKITCFDDVLEYNLQQQFSIFIAQLYLLY